MAKQIINIGTGPNTGTADSLRVAFEKVNSNFTELYNTATADLQLPDQTNNAGKFLRTDGTDLSWVTISGSGQDGADGNDGIDGSDGVGIPTGGTAGQVLAKINSDDYNTEWVNQSGGGATSYTPNNTDNWDDPAVNTIQAALDELAAKVTALQNFEIDGGNANTPTAGELLIDGYGA